MATVIKEYECEDCGPFEVETKHDRQCRKCPKCKSTKIERLISRPVISKMSGARTIGSLIEENNRKNPLTREKVMGQSESEHTKKSAEAQKMRKLATMTPEQTEKYIHTGKMP
jgi:putative FmdB family regulatory protein